MIFENESPSPLISAKPMPSKRLFTLPRIDQSIIRSTNLGKKLGISVGRGLTSRMSRDEERGNHARIRNQPDRAPRHWLNPLVGPVRAALRLQVRPYPRGRLRRKTPLSFSHAEPAV